MDRLARVLNAMEFEGMTSVEGLTLMDIFLSKAKNHYKNGLCIEFGTYKGRTAALIANSLDEGYWLHAIEQAEYLEFNKLIKINSHITWHKAKSEIFCTNSLPELVMEQKIIFTHHDASHFFDNVYAELHAVYKNMAPYGVIILDDFCDNYPQVRAAYYYLRYKESFPFELLLVGFNKAILVHEDLFDYWEIFVLDDLLNELSLSKFTSKLIRSDINALSRSFYIKRREESEDPYYGKNWWGDRFYKRSCDILQSQTE